MKNIVISGLLSSCFLTCAYANEPVTMSDATPPIASTYTADSKVIVTYDIVNSVPGPGPTITVSGISNPVTRVQVGNDCGNRLLPAPSVCRIGILIAPTEAQVGLVVDQKLIVNYQSRLPFEKPINFTVVAKPPQRAALAISTNSLVLAANGKPRKITVTASEGSALDVKYHLTAPLPEGTTITPASCGTLSAGDQCVLTINPGAAASVSAGAVPSPNFLMIEGSNTNPVQADISVVTYGNIVQKGYLFTLDDTTSDDKSIGGTVVSLTDNSTGSQWYNGDDITTGANSVIDGQANSLLIEEMQGKGNYAASVCLGFEVDDAGHTPCQTGNACYKNWYLPAICQLGPETNASGCAPGTPNVVEKLFNNGVGEFSATHNYWSSTEFNINPNAFAWYQFFGTVDSHQSFHGAGNKYVDFFAVRCVRTLTN